MTTLSAKEIKAFVIKSLFTDDYTRQIAVMERYITWLKNEPLHTGVEEKEIKEISEPSIIKTASELFDLKEDDFKPF